MIELVLQKQLRKTTGIRGLDELIGGFLAGSTILLLGHPGTGKTTFAKAFVREGLRHGEKVIYISTTEPVENLEKEFEDFKENILFIDAYSWRLPAEFKKEGEFVLSSLTALNELDLMLRRAMAMLNFTQGRIIIDSLTDFLLYAESTSVVKFLQLFNGKVKATSSVALITIEEGIHEDRIVATISFLCDGFIHFAIKENKRVLRIEKMRATAHPLDWIEFEIGEKGVDLKIGKFFGG